MRRLLLSTLLALATAACSTPAPTPEPAQPAVAPEPPPECFAGCALNERGACQTMAQVADWNSSERQAVDCDPRCCEARWADTDMDEQDGPDADDDGIFDDADNCPDEAEDVDAFEDDDGCPEPDNDGDGIADADDVCPLDPEDADGFQDADGCPDP